MRDPEIKAQAIELARHILTTNSLQCDVYECIEQDEANSVSKDFAAHIVRTLEQSLKDPDTNDFDVAIAVAAETLRKGGVMPLFLATFAADVLDGSKKRPTKRGPDQYAKWERDRLFCKAVVEINNRFGFAKYSKNELFHGDTAAEIVAKEAGVDVNVVIKSVKRFGGKIDL